MLKNLFYDCHDGFFKYYFPPKEKTPTHQMEKNIIVSAWYEPEKDRDN